MMTQSSYQVIARRWRPKQFDEIVGQEHIVRTLKNAIQSNRIAHAYLFVGPRGTGKTTTARIFAKALNAEGGPNVAPDDSSEISRAILSGSCMDVIEIDGASNNGVEDVRQLREDVQYAPSQGNFKVYIIDEVHMLSNNAWNALLKTLEEPPSHVKFIFATTEAHKVLPTVVSRCQRFEFRPIPDEQIIGRLKQIADTEGIEVDEAALRSVARMADGGMRDAQSILDQLISFCGTTITEQNVLDVYGLAAREDIEAMVKAMAAADYEGLFAKIEALASEGRDLYRILQDIQGRVREALVEAIHAGGRSSALGVPMTAEALTRMLDGIQQGEEAVRTGLSQRVNFEVALLRAIDQSRSRAIDSVIQSLTQIAAGLPEDAGQKKIGTSPAAESGSSETAAGGAIAAGETIATGSASGEQTAPVSVTDSASDVGVPLSTPFAAVPPRRRMTFPMLGGGTTPFDRPAPVARTGALTGSSAGAAGAARGKTSAASANGLVADPSEQADGSGAFADEFSGAPAYTPFSTPAGGAEDDSFGWERSLAQVEEGSEFLSHPEDEDEEAGAGGSAAIAVKAMATAGGNLAGSAPQGKVSTYGVGSAQFNAALGSVPKLAQQALEALLRVQFRHLEERS